MSKREHDAAVAVYRHEIHTYDKPWYRSSLELVEKHGLEDLACLDLCSGNGEFAMLLKRKRRMRMTCADYIPTQVESVRSLGFDTFWVDLDDEAETVDAAAEPHRGRFDMVVSLAAIEHVFNTDNLLRFAHAVLRPDGYLLVNTPNIEFAGYRLYSLLSGNRPFGDGHHVRFWNFRFLQTHVFLNGFRLVDDYRRFYTLPTDLMTRAFRGRKPPARLAAGLFRVCSALQRLPFGMGRGLFTDELTVLCRRDDTPPVGFELHSVRRSLDRFRGGPAYAQAVERLKSARRRRWLDEHLYLADLVDGL